VPNGGKMVNGTAKIKQEDKMDDGQLSRLAAGVPVDGATTAAIVRVNDFSLALHRAIVDRVCRVPSKKSFLLKNCERALYRLSPYPHQPQHHMALLSRPAQALLCRAKPSRNTNLVRRKHPCPSPHPPPLCQHDPSRLHHHRYSLSSTRNPCL